MRARYPASFPGRHESADQWRAVLAFWRASKRAFAKRRLYASMRDWRFSEKRYAFTARNILRDEFAVTWHYDAAARAHFEAVMRGEKPKYAAKIEVFLMDLAIANVGDAIKRLANGRFCLDSCVPALML